LKPSAPNGISPHRLSHASLLGETPTTSLRPGRAAVDALVVPFTREARHIDTAARLAADTGCLLVVLSSKEANPVAIRERISRKAGLVRSVLIHMEDGYRLPGLNLETSDQESLHDANAHRTSDLSVKRNIGLLLAKMLGWAEIVFLDDDIRQISEKSLRQLSSQLRRQPVAGFRSRDFPDNSVVCHAARLSGLGQDVFVSGAALGVACTQETLPFFPQIYNEDWLFFAEYVAAGRLGAAGDVRQLEYDPFRTPERARREEFGDLIAEGLFALLEEGRGPEEAVLPFWERYVQTRQDFLNRVDQRLARNDHRGASRALVSVEAAMEMHDHITPALCAEFVRLWQYDRASWNKYLTGLSACRTLEQAVDRLELTVFDKPGLRSVVAAGFG
jgi:hypothetical protein